MELLEQPCYIALNFIAHLSMTNSSNHARRTEDERPDVPALMAEIRARVKQDIEQHKDQKKPLLSYAANHDREGSRKAGELLHSEELRYLNTNHSYALRLNLDGIKSHRPGLIGKLIVKVKRKLLVTVWDQLKDYFMAERDYQANLVRLLNDMTKYIDARDASNFWELIRKVDYDVTRAVERIERIADEQNATTHSLEKRLFDNLREAVQNININLGELNAASQRYSSELKTVDSVTRGLESLVNRGAQPEVPAASGVPAAESGKVDVSYLLLENRFRGSEAEIARRLAIYPPYFKSAARPVLEIGGGRGELQALLRESDIKSYSVDVDRAMVEASVSGGADARLGDGIAHLRSVPDRSLGGVIAVQVVEHLTRDQLQELFSLCTRKLEPGSLVIFETINPQSVLALSSNYFRDPTHVWPLHPDTLGFTMSLAGLKVREVRYLSPVPEEGQLKEIPVQDYMTPRWQETVETLNLNIRQLNKLLYGYQDFCIVAEVE